MNLTELLNDKSIKAKGKVIQISEWLTKGTLPTDELLAYVEKQNPSNKATCIEAIEFATKDKPALGDESEFLFVTKMLKENEPRVKWESAKVICNTAHLHPKKLKGTIDHLLINANYDGTVVRWATAMALGKILTLKTDQNKTLLPILEKLCAKEKENSIQKKYQDAFKKVKK